MASNSPTPTSDTDALVSALIRLRSQYASPVASSSRGRQRDPPELGTFELPTKIGVTPLYANSAFVIDVDRGKYLPLYKAAMKGDWESARSFLKDDQTALTASITIFKWTVLHVACGQGHWKFVDELVQYLSPEALALPDLVGATALHYAANAGSIECVKTLLRINPGLTQIARANGDVPLLVATVLPTTPQQKKVVRHLCLATADDGPDSPFASPKGFRLMLFLIANEYLDIGIYLMGKYPYLAAPCRETRSYVLAMLIQNAPSVFESRSRLGFWESIVYHFVPVELEEVSLEEAQTPARQLWRSIVSLVPALRRIFEEKSKHKYALQLVEMAFSQASSLNNAEMLQLLSDYAILANAAEKGIVEIFRICLEFFPDAVWFTTNFETLLQTSIRFRQEKVFNFLLDTMEQTKLMACWPLVGVDTTTLHVAARLAPFEKLNSITGSALQMQSEIQWFKAVEKLVHPVYHLTYNDHEETPRATFTAEHNELRERGEKWMKDTANSCMLAATLIATMVFAATFTVPGGNNQDTGFPIFLSKPAFRVFAISDALALFSSSTSILMFLSILTSRFAAEDFLYALPIRLIIGFASLFLAIVTMMVAFGATLLIVLSEQLAWIVIPVHLLAFIPVGLFVMLQLPLFIHMLKFTFWSNIPWRSAT